MKKHLNISLPLLKAYAYLNGGSHFQPSQLRLLIKTATTDEGYDCKGYEVRLYGMSDDEAWYIKTTGHPSEDVPFDHFYLKDLVLDGTEEDVISKILEKDVKDHLNRITNTLKYVTLLCSDAGLV
jgi:hypothetical protein